MKRLMPLILAATAPAYADQRTAHIFYTPDHIIPIAGHVGIQTMIEFGDDEHIENIAVGDSSAWQITPNKRANLIFIKPLMATTRTNMTVITDKRRYLFEIFNGGRNGRKLYSLRFTYPEEPKLVLVAEKQNPAPPLPINTNWQVKGDKQLTPARIYDDTVSTYIAWPSTSEIPAILVRGADNSEGPVNYTLKGDYLVIDGVAHSYVLRIGKASTVLTNLSPATPKPVAATAEDAK